MNLSRAIDGDLPAAERAALIDAVLTDPELTQRWHRYHAIGDLMRDGALGADLTARVRARLEADPTMDAGTGATVVRLARPLQRRAWVHTPAFGLALAASVAVATVVGLRALMPGLQPGHAMAVAPGGIATPTQTLLEGSGSPGGFPASAASSGQVGAGPLDDDVRAASGPLVHGADPAGGGATAVPIPQARLADYLERHRHKAHASMLVGADQAPLAGPLVGEEP